MCSICVRRWRGRCRGRPAAGPPGSRAARTATCLHSAHRGSHRTAPGAPGGAAGNRRLPEQSAASTPAFTDRKDRALTPGWPAESTPAETGSSRRLGVLSRCLRVDPPGAQSTQICVWPLLARQIASVAGKSSSSPCWAAARGRRPPTDCGGQSTVVARRARNGAPRPIDSHQNRFRASTRQCGIGPLR